MCVCGGGEGERTGAGGCHETWPGALFAETTPRQWTWEGGTGNRLNVEWGQFFSLL